MKTYSNFISIDIFGCKKKTAKCHSIDQFHTFKKIKFSAITTNCRINETLDIRFVKPKNNEYFLFIFNANRFKKMALKKTSLTIIPAEVFHYYNCPKITVPLAYTFKAKGAINNNSNTNISAAGNNKIVGVYTLK